MSPTFLRGVFYRKEAYQYVHAQHIKYLLLALFWKRVCITNYIRDFNKQNI